MNEIDALQTQDSREPAHVERHRQRIPGRRRKRHVKAAERLDLARKLAGIGGDEGAEG